MELAAGGVVTSRCPLVCCSFRLPKITQSKVPFLILKSLLDFDFDDEIVEDNCEDGSTTVT
jgi:hypothetical protein